ncbi:MAG TPA: Rieske 2Fe-2S domain-containing protein [Ktedonobacterales bacterium]|jgi:nitrite reductase/ring-hydroxylating ferredoxin subunit/uncharacterized membrane protein
MLTREQNRLIERQEWMEPASDAIQKAVSGALTGGATRRRLEDFLIGVWLGHPLHPLLSDIPVGAWTTALGLDAFEMSTGHTQFAPGADAAVVIGVVGGLASAITGLAQWQYTDAQPRRIGLAHALLNLTGTALYITSAALRARGKRSAGQGVALLGYGCVAAAGYLGGDLAYNTRIGVNHAPGQTPPDQFTAVLPERALAEGTAQAVDVGDLRMMLVREHGRIYALARECSHLGGPLEEGAIADGCVTCPWHSSRFALADGRVVHGPATFPQPHFETRLRNGQIEVKMTPQ